MKQFLYLLITLIFLFFADSSVSAQMTLPPFTRCNNPSGSAVADYSDGEHAIVGIAGLKTGSDKVFDQGSDNYTQCYCPASGETGVKTDWLAAGSISKEDQNVLITQGWVYIANGADWGLSNQPYLAKNSEFSCAGGPGGGGGDSGGSSSGGSGGSSGSGGGQGGGGDVLGISTLAGTGNPNTKFEVIITILVASALILYGYKIQKNSK